MEEELSRDEVEYRIRIWELVEKNLKSIFRSAEKYMEKFPKESKGKKLQNATRRLEKALKEATEEITALKLEMVIKSFFH